MKELIERNKKIYDEWKKGKTQFELALEYKMTPSNVARLIRNHKIKYGK